MGIDMADVLGGGKVESVEILNASKTEADDGSMTLIVELENDDGEQVKIGFIGEGAIQSMLDKGEETDDGKQVTKVPKSKIDPEEDITWVNQEY